MDINKPFKTISGNENDPKSMLNDTCSLHEIKNSSSSKSLIQKDQEYVNNYNKGSFLYLIEQESKRAKLHIYDPESLKEEIKILDTSKPLSFAVPITQLPNNELLCFDSSKLAFNKTFIIDKNYKVRDLPSEMSYFHTSGIYFNNNIYCFGGAGRYNFQILDVSNKFDLNENRWIKLTPIPQPDYYIHSLAFQGNILISGYSNRNIWLYSIDIDSFSTIPFDFSYDRIKILAYAEKLYLIESNDGWIYESEDEYNWNLISNSILSSDLRIFQVYLSYNKGGIYLVISDWLNSNKDLYKYYYKFDVNQKFMMKRSWEAAINAL